MLELVTWAALLDSIPVALTSCNLPNHSSVGSVHCLNNEVMYLAQESVHPVSLAVGNTIKRVFILVASFMSFHNLISHRFRSRYRRRPVVFSHQAILRVVRTTGSEGQTEVWLSEKDCQEQKRQTSHEVAASSNKRMLFLRE